MSSDDHITARDWRCQPPLRLRMTKKLDIHWCWINCSRCPHMRAVAIAPYIIRWGPHGWQKMLRQDRTLALTAARKAWSFCPEVRGSGLKCRDHLAAGTVVRAASPEL